MPRVLEIRDRDKILISRTDRLGDLILALPFVETMKQRYPKTRIDVISSLYASPILENNSSISKILRVQNDQLLTNKLYKKDLLQKVSKEKYSAVIVLYPERRISRLFYEANIPIRVGTAGRFHSIFFSHHLLHSRKKNIKHEFEYNLDFTRFFREGPTVREPRIYLRDKELRSARRILANAGVTSPFVVLHPGSGGSAERWPLDSYLQLYALLEREGVQVVFSGSEEEGNIIDRGADKYHMKVRKVTGDTDLRTLAAALSLARVVVANSTGPLHVAVAVGTQVVGLYPSRNTMSPVRWGPLGRNSRVIQPDNPVCTCPPRQCTCMLTIQPEHVARETTDLLLQPA